MRVIAAELNLGRVQEEGVFVEHGRYFKRAGSE